MRAGARVDHILRGHSGVLVEKQAIGWWYIIWERPLSHMAETFSHILELEREIVADMVVMEENLRCPLDHTDPFCDNCGLGLGKESK